MITKIALILVTFISIAVDSNWSYRWDISSYKAKVYCNNKNKKVLFTSIGPFCGTLNEFKKKMWPRRYK